MHLFHVLEEEKGTTFLQFFNECRVRFATTLLAAATDGAIDIRQIAEQSGFQSIEEFNDAFVTTFGTSAEEYSRQFNQ
jgi:AraC-like DNA-binding protein